MQKNTLISVIMPVYNAKDYVGRAIESVLSQDFESFELILVDDGSTDGSADICDGYAKKDTRIVIIHQKNAGTCAARNAALDVAKGKYIAFCDHDDEFLPHLLRDNYELIEKEQADVVQFAINRIEKNKIVSTSILPTTKINANSMRDMYTFIRLVPDFIDVWNHLYKREIIGNLRFNCIYRHGQEDKEFNIKVLFQIKTKYIYNLQNYYNHYIYDFSSGNSFSRSNTVFLEKEYNSIFLTEYEYLRKCHIEEKENKANLEKIILENLFFIYRRIDIKGENDLEGYQKSPLFNEFSSELSLRSRFLLWMFKNKANLFVILCKNGWCQRADDFSKTALCGFFANLYQSKRGRWLFDLCNFGVKVITLPFRLFK